MGTAGPSQSVVKKVYFIKRARKGEELTTLLKNKFKSIDAIRDLLMWYEEGRDFAISLRRGEDGTDPSSSPATAFFGESGVQIPWPADAGPKKSAASSSGDRSVVISPWLPTAQNYRNLIDVIGLIISWMDLGRDFDITISPQDTFDASLN